MPETNLNGLDLNLLPPLAALLQLRNVTQAATKAGMSQPAMSRALARLRTQFDDPLLVRSAGGYSLSAKGQGLLLRVEAALQNVSSVFQEPVFDPFLEQRRIRICCTDMQTVTLVPKLMARLSVEAPGVNIVIVPYAADLMQRMLNGSIDLTFALASSALPPGAISIPLADDELVLVMRRNHPAAKRKWALPDYGKYQHVGISILGDGISEIDAELASQGLQRRMALVTPYFIAALAAVAQSDLVTTLSKNFALQFAESFGLILKRPPLQNITLRPVLVSAHIRTGDKLLAWLQNMICEVAADKQQNPGAV